jgi:hypothetical protein
MADLPVTATPVCREGLRLHSEAPARDTAPPAGSSFGDESESPGHPQRVPSQRMSLADLAQLAGCREASDQVPGTPRLFIPSRHSSTPGGGGGRAAQHSGSFFRSGWGVLPGEGVDLPLHVHLTMTQPLYSRLVRPPARRCWGVGADLMGRGLNCFERARSRAALPLCAPVSP